MIPGGYYSHNIPPAKHNKGAVIQVIDKNGALFRSDGEFWVPLAAVEAPAGSTFVMASTTSSGGLAQRPIAIPSVNGSARMTQDVLLDLLPLPVLRNILDPVTVNIAGITKPAGVTVTLEDAPGEAYGKALRFELPAGLTNQKIIIPVPTDFRGNYPKALPRVDFRVKCSDYAQVPRLYFWACENTAGTQGYLWGINDEAAGNSQFDLKNSALVSAWNGAFRTMGCTPYSLVSKITSPSAWDETAPEYTVKTICITVNTTNACTFWLNRVSSPQWERGAIITQLDGGYWKSYAPVFQEFKKRGWPGVLSRIVGDDAEYFSDSQYQEVIGAGWDLCQHVAKEPRLPMDGTVTDAQFRSYIANWQRFMQGLGLIGSGFRTCSSLTNSGQYASNDAAGILRSAGVLGGRGTFSDAQFGVDPYNRVGGASVNYNEWAKPVPGGFSPRWGRHNRWYQDASYGGTLGTGFDSRNIFAGSDTEKILNRCIAGRDLAWIYIHRCQNYDGVTYPSVGNISPQYAASYIAMIDAAFAAGTLIPISATQADMLTYDRPGDVYLSWDGAWRSRRTGNVAL